MLRKFVFTLILLAILGGAIYFGYNAVINRELNINSWFASGKTLGVDVSSYQENVDFAKLKEQKIEFAYIKATEGAKHVDPSFKLKWEAAKDAGVISGAYHYFNYGISGADQAKNFIKTVGGLNDRLIPAVDMELTVEEVYNPPEKEVVVKGLKSFVAVIEEEYGVKPLIYAQKDYYDKYLAEDFKDYPRWVRNVFYPAFIDFGEDWLLWQYHDKGVLEGYKGEKYIDLNMVNQKFGLDALKYK